MEGIPVKISEQYKPPKKISLPGSIMNRLNAEIKFEEYDFSLERSVVKQMSRLRELRKSAAEDMRQKHETLELEESTRQIPLATPVPVSCQNNPILTPVPISSTRFSKKETDGVGPINFSDFESDTSSPFDNMELKTINDLEELAHVLGNSSSSSSANASTTNNHQPIELKAKLCEGSLPPPNGLCWTNPHCIKGSWLNRTMPLQSYVVQSVHSSPMASLPSISTAQEMGSTSSPLAGQGSAPIGVEPDTVPRILQQLQNQLQERRALVQTKPAFKPSIVMNATVAKESEQNRLKVNIENKPSSLPNPFENLLSPCQSLAKRVAEMGFPLARAARAAQLFGNDEARVIEFLLQVQSLEDVNLVSGDRAEKALIANDYNEEDTLAYVEKLKQLMDLGFREEQILHALDRFNNDWDRALDSLIS